MASGYTIDFTDQNPFSQFELREYTTDGPVNPQSLTLDSRATRASTSLLLYGKGSPNYGERIAENMIHMLEHFAGDIAPVYPISGQMWFDRSGATSQLRIFDSGRYAIVQDPDNPSTATWLGINPPSLDERNELVAHYAVGQRVKAINGTTGEELNFAVVTAAAVRGSGVVAFEVTPPPSSVITAGGWFIGGWERVLQNNTKLTEQLDANLHKIVNLESPTFNRDAANKEYVDLAILNATNLQDTLAELDDVELTNPADNEVLMYDAGTNKWINSDGASTFLNVVGGDLFGTLDMNNNFIINVASPTSGSHAANRDYVDAQIALVVGGSVGALGDLSDVVLPGPISAGSVLVYSGVDWRSEGAADFITNNNILTRSGGTLTGPLYLSTNSPTDPNEAASRQFVLNQLGTITGDGVVDAALWSPTTKVLTLTRTQGLSDLNVTLTGAGGSSFDITHTIIDPNAPSTPLPEDPTALAWENLFFDSAAYPSVTVEEILAQVNSKLGQLGQPKYKFVFSSNGGSVINFREASVAGQANPAWPGGSGGGEAYAVGTNRLSVYVNGVKQIASEAGYHEAATATPAGFGLWPGTETGLNPATTYQFRVNVNGQGNVTVSVLGSDAFRVGNLIEAINAQADANYFQSGSPNPQWAFGARLYDGNIFIVSALTGAGSSIDILDGTTNPLFAGMVGNVSGTGSFTMDLSGTTVNGETNYFPPATYGYREIGRFGAESYRIEFDTVPPSGAVVEVLIEPDIFIELT